MKKGANIKGAGNGALNNANFAQKTYGPIRKEQKYILNWQENL